MQRDDLVGKMRHDARHESLGEWDVVPDDAAAVARVEDELLLAVADVDLGGGPCGGWGGG